MLYDLNIVWTPSTSAEDLQKTLKFAKSLGYDVVALNNIISHPIPRIVTNEIPLLNPPSTAQLQSSPNFRNAPVSATPTILRRATVIVADPGTTNHKLPEFARTYDILAVRPTTSQGFQWACLSADDSSLISLDMAVPMGYYIAPRTAMAAVQRGARFEICYGQAVQTRGDGQRARTNFIANTLSLLRATRGRGVVVSSEARSALALRGPADVVNLLAVWGLGPEKGMEALRGVPRSVVVNEGIKRRGFRGVVDIIQTAGLDPSPPENTERSEKRERGKDQKTKCGPQGQKRKTGEGIENSQPGEGGQATLSKRQAKKLRLAAQKAEGDQETATAAT